MIHHRACRAGRAAADAVERAAQGVGLLKLLPAGD